MSNNCYSLLLTLLVVASSSMFASCDNKSLSEVDSMRFSITDGHSAAVTRAAESYTIKSTDGRAMLTVTVEDNTNAPVTKGDEMKTSDLQTIGVIANTEEGANYFYNLQFKKGSDGVMTCNPAYYWPGSTSIDCYLYYPYMDKTSETVWGISLSGTKEAPAIKYRTPGNALIHRDLLYGFCNASSGTPQVTMKHILSAIEFRVGDHMPINSRISSFLLYGITVDGTVTLDGQNPIWESNPITAGATTPGMTFYPNIWKMSDDMKMGDLIFGDFFVLPQKFAPDSQAYLLIDGLDAAGNSIQYEFALANADWEMGKRYTYAVNFPKN